MPVYPFSPVLSKHLRYIFVGSDDGNVQVTRDGGYSWTLLNSKQFPKGLYVSRITASAFKEGRVYLTLNGYRNDHFAAYVFVSEDYFFAFCTPSNFAI